MSPSLCPHTTLPEIRVFPPQTRRGGTGAILTRRTQNTLYPFRFHTPAICTVRADFVRKACCHVSACGTFCRQNDIRFLYPILHQLEEKSGVFSTFLSRLAPKRSASCGEKSGFLRRKKMFSQPNEKFSSS